MKAPLSFIRIAQHPTVATVTHYVGGYVRDVKTFHHREPEKVYFGRGGKKKCIIRFRSKVKGIASKKKGSKRRASSSAS